MPVELPAVAAPMVRPVTVTVTALLAAIAAVAVVMTICVLVIEATPTVTPTPFIDTRDDPVKEKNPCGNVSVMVLAIKSIPPDVGVNENVAAQPVFSATRSAVVTLNVTSLTEPPITPDIAAADAVTSKLVLTVIEPPAVAAPMVRPVSVTVTATPPASAVPEFVMTMEVSPGAPGVSVALAIDSAAKGVAEAEK